MITSKRVRLLIVLASFSLLGIIATQVYWVKEAWHLREEQFDSKVKISLRMVVNRMFTLANADTTQQLIESVLCESSCGTVGMKDSIQAFNQKILDSLLSDEFKSMSLGDDYVYCIYLLHGKRFVTGRPEAFMPELLESPLSLSLSCIKKANAQILAVWFPQKQSIIMGKLWGWLLLSVIFTLVITLTYAYTIISFIRQKKLSALKTDFINNMTHELRTPVSAISLASEMLLNSEVSTNPVKVEKYASLIFEQNTRMKGLVEHVLQVSMLEQGKFTLNVDEFDAHEVLRNLARSYRVILEARGGQIELHLNASPSIIKADKLHFTSIISSLLDNANKYSPTNPKVKIATLNADEGIEIQISDNGIGIAPEYHSEIFRKFFRVPNGNRHDVKGYGLGLYYVYTMVTAHGGQIGFISEEGTGTTFDLHFLYNGPTDLVQDPEDE